MRRCLFPRPRFRRLRRRLVIAGLVASFSRVRFPARERGQAWRALVLTQNTER